MEKSPRHYIRRKRSFNECTSLIIQTLRVVHQARNEPFSDEGLAQKAADHAYQIDAACWSPRSKMSDADYKALTMTKTIELCSAILGRTFGNLDQAKLTVQTAVNQPELFLAHCPNGVRPVFPPAFPIMLQKAPEPENAFVSYSKPVSELDGIDFEYGRSISQMDDIKRDFSYLDSHL
jgi:hypothetical protein